VSNGKITVLEHGGEMWVRVDAVHPLRDRITELESKLTAADEAWHEQEDELQSLRSRLQACFELVERPGLTSDGVVWELCKMRDASIQPNVVERHRHRYGDDGRCECGEHALGPTMPMPERST
jgi:predicted nuclease with TOPRIM domain